MEHAFAGYLAFLVRLEGLLDQRADLRPAVGRPLVEAIVNAFLRDLEAGAESEVVLNPNLDALQLVEAGQGNIPLALGAALGLPMLLTKDIEKRSDVLEGVALEPGNLGGKLLAETDDPADRVIF